MPGKASTYRHFDLTTLSQSDKKTATDVIIGTCTIDLADLCKSYTSLCRLDDVVTGF